MAQPRARIAAIVACLGALAVGCSTEKPAPPPPEAAAAALGATGVDSVKGCPVTGLWTECTVLKRLDEAGLVVTKDSAPARDKGIAKPGILLHPAHGQLELFFYGDTAARALAQAGLDRHEYIELADDPTFKNEWTIIRAWNMLGLLRVPSAEERERIWNALMAGPPQPPHDKDQGRAGH
jgi:hypothetical protein